MRSSCCVPTSRSAWRTCPGAAEDLISNTASVMSLKVSWSWFKFFSFVFTHLHVSPLVVWTSLGIIFFFVYKVLLKSSYSTCTLLTKHSCAHTNTHCPRERSACCYSWWHSCDVFSLHCIYLSFTSMGLTLLYYAHLHITVRFLTLDVFIEAVKQPQIHNLLCNDLVQNAKLGAMFSVKDVWVHWKSNDSSLELTAELTFLCIGQ